MTKKKTSSQIWQKHKENYFNNMNNSDVRVMFGKDSKVSRLSWLQVQEI